jgi:hypothetical protein
MPQGGAVWQDKDKLGAVIRRALRLCRLFAIAAAVLAIPLAVYLLNKHGAPIAVSLAIAAVLVPSHVSMTLARLACGLDFSRIGLGSDRLHHVVSAQDGRYLVATALEIGVAHFDTAARSHGGTFPFRQPGQLGCGFAYLSGKR